MPALRSISNSLYLPAPEKAIRSYISEILCSDALGLSATSSTPSAHSIATIERPLAIPFLAYSALSAIICSGET